MELKFPTFRKKPNKDFPDTAKKFSPFRGHGIIVYLSVLITLITLRIFLAFATNFFADVAPDTHNKSHLKYIPTLLIVSLCFS